MYAISYLNWATGFRVECAIIFLLELSNGDLRRTVMSGSSPRWEYLTSGYQIHPLMGLNLRYHFLSQKYIAEKMKYTNMSSRMGCSYWYLSIFYICVQKWVMCTANFRPSSKRAIFMTCLGLYWNKKLVLNLFPWYWNSNTTAVVAPKLLLSHFVTHQQTK